MNFVQSVPDCSAPFGPLGVWPMLSRMGSIGELVLAVAPGAGMAEFLD
jgi:hypothetical protein